MKRIFYLYMGFLLILLLILTACGSNTGPSSALAKEAFVGDPATGQTLFMSTCAACHGPDGQGLPGLGKNLVSSKFVAGKSDQELVDFIKVGRGPDDPLNTTGVTMPAKGGRSSFSDEDLYNIVAYIRTIHDK